MEDVIGEFTALSSRQSPAINSSLTARKRPALQVISESDWRKAEFLDTAKALLRSFRGSGSDRRSKEIAEENRAAASLIALVA
jgi:hypothetical protein